jgi:hypothetical protein
MGDIIEFQKLTGICCHECGERMSFFKGSNEIRCTKPGCKKGYLRSSHQMEVRVDGDRTIIEKKS